MKKQLFFLLAFLACTSNIMMATRNNEIQKLKTKNHELAMRLTNANNIRFDDDIKVSQLKGDIQELNTELNNQETFCCLSSCCLLSALIATNAAWYFASTIDKKS